MDEYVSYGYMVDGYKCKDCDERFWREVEDENEPCPECGGQLEESEVYVST